MKKTVIILCLFTFTHTVFSQNMPKEGYNAFGFNVTGLANVAIGNQSSSILSGSVVPDPLSIFVYPVTVEQLLPQNMLFFKHYYANGIASRLSIGINSFGNSNTYGDSTGFALGYSTTETKLSAFSVGLGIGGEKHFSTNAAKVDPYMGADINFAFLGGISYSTNTDYTDTTFAYTSEYTVDYPGGLGLGLNLLGGFNYFFSDNISIGGEAGIGFHYVKMGGDYTSTYIYSPTPGTSSTTNDDGTVKNTNTGVNVGSYGGINLTVYW